MVYVLDRRKNPIMPCTEKRARLLLGRNRAVIHRMVPFTIRLKDRAIETSEVQPIRLKLDPGTEFTGAAVVRDAAVIGLYEVHHRTDIKKRLDKRRILRRSRRSRKTRHREPRYLNRRPARCLGCGKNAQHGSKACRHCLVGEFDSLWRVEALPPSLRALVDQQMQWVKGMRKHLPVSSISVEVAKFDTRTMKEAASAGYSPATRGGHAIREYLLNVFDRTCVYCQGHSGDPILNIDHVIPVHPNRGPRGSNRLSNLVVACVQCNKAKGNRQPLVWVTQLKTSGRFLDAIRALNVTRVMAHVERPLHNATAMNMTRLRLLQELRATGLEVEVGCGADTKFNRVHLLCLPKTHYYDAVAVGNTPIERICTNVVELHSAVGRGNRQIAGVDRHGFPWRWRRRKKQYFGFQTGDLVQVDLVAGKYQGRWRGRIAVRASGSFDLKDELGHRLCPCSYRHCRLLQRGSGWDYAVRPAKPKK